MIVTAAPQLMSRQPLGKALHSNAAASSRQPSVVSSTSRSSLCDEKTPQLTSRPLKRELWEYLPSTPSTRTTSAVTSAMPSPLAKKFPAISGSNKENLRGSTCKRKPILEWACARVAKRQRMSPDNDDDLYEPTEILSGNDSIESDKTLVDLEILDAKSKVSDEVCPSASLSAVVIPPEYSSKFAPDVVLGASLLLTFQYSLK